ncbi:hypothetical protein ACWD7Y_12485 [Streptomyces drozdowiczii]
MKETALSRPALLMHRLEDEHLVKGQLGGGLDDLRGEAQLLDLGNELLLRRGRRDEGVARLVVHARLGRVPLRLEVAHRLGLRRVRIENRTRRIKCRAQIGWMPSVTPGSLAMEPVGATVVILTGSAISSSKAYACGLIADHVARAFEYRTPCLARKTRSRKGAHRSERYLLLSVLR